MPVLSARAAERIYMRFIKPLAWAFIVCVAFYGVLALVNDIPSRAPIQMFSNEAPVITYESASQ